MKGNYLVLHKTHGETTILPVAEGDYSYIERWLADRTCPAEHYRIILIEEEVPVLSYACPHFHI